MSKKAKNSGVIELSPPPHRQGYLPDAYSHPPIENENEVYLEASAPHGQRLNLPEFAVATASFNLIVCGIGFVKISDPLFFWTMWGITLFFLVVSILTPPPPLPLRLNRQTQEVYFFFKNRLYRSSWQEIKAMVSLFRNPAPVYTLYFGFDQGEDKIPLWVANGRGPVAEIPLRMWDYYCQYMETGLPIQVQEETPEDEKSEHRKYVDRQTRGPLGVLIYWLIIKPFDLFAIVLPVKLGELSFRPAKWPQEIIDVCESHPLLKKKLT